MRMKRKLKKSKHIFHYPACAPGTCKGCDNH